MSVRRWAWLAVGLVACGDAVVGSAVVVDDVVGPSLGSDAPPDLSEPCATATAGAACTGTPAVCEVGDHANPACNGRLVCTGFRWEYLAPRRACNDPCADASTAGTCGSATLRCEYPEERQTCGCVLADAGVAEPGADADADAATDADADAATDADAAADAGEPPRIWTCVRALAGCPRVRPRIGDRCVVPMTCSYGACVLPGGAAMECVGELWQLDERGACPR